MCWGDLSAVITQLMSKCLWSGWRWYCGVKEMPSPFPCSPLICEWLWKKTQTKKIIWRFFDSHMKCHLNWLYRELPERIFGKNFLVLYCCKDDNVTRDKKFLQSIFFVCFWGFGSSSWNIISFFNLGLESSISWNIRTFFRVGVFLFFELRKLFPVI